MKPGIHCVRTHWIRGFMAFHRVRRREPGQREAGASVGRGAGGERGRDGGSVYGMMWEKGGVWGLGVI